MDVTEKFRQNLEDYDDELLLVALKEDPETGAPPMERIDQPAAPWKQKEDTL